jgi:hypothetical protein
LLLLIKTLAKHPKPENPFSSTIYNQWLTIKLFELQITKKASDTKSSETINFCSNKTFSNPDLSQKRKNFSIILQFETILAA